MAILTYAQLVAKKNLIIVSGTQYGITAEQVNDLFQDICDSVIFPDSDGKSLLVDDVDADQYKVAGTKVIGAQVSAIQGCVESTVSIQDSAAKTTIIELQKVVGNLITALQDHGLIAS